MIVTPPVLEYKYKYNSTRPCIYEQNGHDDDIFSSKIQSFAFSTKLRRKLYVYNRRVATIGISLTLPFF
jgi:hypothetical protein